jgi:ribosomal RNA-processing protein 8
MFAVEGWKLGQIVTQTQPKKKLKRKRDEKEGNVLPKTGDSATGFRKNPFSMKEESGSNNLRKQDDNPKLLQEVSIGQTEKEEKDVKPIELSKESKKRAERKAAKKAKKRLRKSLQSNEDNVNDESIGIFTSAGEPTIAKVVKPTLTPLQQKMRAKLTGSQFRHINEKLYTTQSSEALQLFTDQPSLFHDVMPFIDNAYYSIIKDFDIKFNHGPRIQSTFSLLYYPVKPNLRK